VYAPTADWTGTVTLDSVTYDVTGRASRVTNTSYWSIGVTGESNSVKAASAYDGAIGAITALPSGSQSWATSYSTSSYSAASLEKNGTLNWALNDGNFAGGIDAVYVNFGVGAYQFGFSPAIPKDNTKVLALTVKNSWARKTL